MLSVGNKVFVPNYGAGVIKSVEFRKVYDTVYKCVDITLTIDNMSLLIPVSRIEAYRMREVVTKETLEKCLLVLSAKPAKIEKKWTKRYRENNDKIYTGDLSKECEVVRDLYYLKKKGIMPPGEQKILDKSESLVASEIMLILDINLQEAYKIIKETCNR
ncbi:transcriptional regulator [Clostridium swellfunianum]|uniref:CarD family transcriptional regulator n=1 Tax=Clostridium swellfunianum TaxID=1367462 RepID=UPI002030442C|nr:CarD family transcriptional regulator [Clostridium swellfunianum]MCM0650353.1 transcriptional regulator [Clostridium swellfunianum]